LTLAVFCAKLGNCIKVNAFIEWPNGTDLAPEFLYEIGKEVEKVAQAATFMRKIKRKRKAKKSSRLRGLTPGIRMKGGVLFDPTVNGFIAMVHIWDNVHCHGAPEEWRYPEIFSTEEAAMQYYKTSIRPSLERMMAEMANGQPGGTFIHRKLEE